MMLPGRNHARISGDVLIPCFSIEVLCRVCFIGGEWAEIHLY